MSLEFLDTHVDYYLNQDDQKLIGLRRTVGIDHHEAITYYYTVKPNDDLVKTWDDL